MSDILGVQYDPDADHLPLITRKATHETQYGGWEEWSAGCICGWYKSTTLTHYIPSRQSAERLYKAHLSSFSEEQPEPLESAEEALLRWASSFMEEMHD